jgi:hypothetical protein
MRADRSDPQRELPPPRIGSSTITIRGRSLSLLTYCVVASATALLATALVGLSGEALAWALVNDSLQVDRPNNQLDAKFTLSAVLIAPVIETALIWALVAVLGKIIADSRLLIGAVSFICGLLHAPHPITMAVGTAAFIVYTYSFMIWSRQRFVLGFISAAVPHALANGALILLHAMTE